MKTQIVPLTRPTKWGSRDITEIELREPNSRDFFELGEPTLITQTENGTSVLVHNNDAIQKYIRRCMINPSGNLDFLDELPLGDALRLKGAVLDFFGTAHASGLSEQPKPSSEVSNGSPEEISSTPA